MVNRSVTLILVAVVALFAATGANATSKAVLEAEIARHAATGKTTVGVAAIHIQSGETVAVNGDKPFPLASTYKVPMAAYALHLVEQGELALDQMIAVEGPDYVPWSPIAQSFPHPGVSLSLLNLLEPMLIHSDNTATDVVLRTVGGGARLTGWLETIGIDGLRVDRPTADLIRDYLQMPPPDRADVSFAQQYAARAATLEAEPSLDQQRLFYDALKADPRDQGTPLAMAALLHRIWTGGVLSDAHADILKAIMGRCLTGAARLSGKLPASVLPIAHKTGTIGGTVNDAGVISLPDGAGDVVLVVFTSGSPADDSSAYETVIAEVARSVYDYFLYR